MQQLEYDEAVRQLNICNACRYCEGYCGAFQALTRYRTFDVPTIDHLANLCHNCRGCYYACQYTEPHEFAVNIPAMLANIRGRNWEQHVSPSWLSRRTQTHSWPYVLLSVLFVLLFSFAIGVPWGSSQAFYTHISHTVLVSIFTPLFLLPLVSLGIGVRRYWHSVGGRKLALIDIKEALGSAATLRQLDGGQGQGCNYEAQDRYSSLRRWAHQATMYGFLLCFASTSLATVYHYMFGLEAPYAFFSAPKLLGVVGGVMLSFGSAWLLLLKRQSSDELGAKNRLAAEYAFIVLLFLVSTTGLLLYWLSGTNWASGLLIVHLAFVATFFVSLPFSKMAHGFFRLAALCREAQLKRQ